MNITVQYEYGYHTAPAFAIIGEKAIVDGVKTVNSVEHAARLLLFLGEQGEVGVSSLARGLSLPRATIYRLLKTLAAFGMIKQSGTNYRLGYRLVELASQVPGLPMVDQEIVPLLRELRDQTGETSHFAVIDGLSVTYLAKVESSHPIRMFSHAGWRGPLHATAVGKVLLAHSSDGVVQGVLRAGLSPLTERTIIEADGLHRALDQVRVEGFAIDDGELIEGLYCLAVPVLTRAGCAGAISVAGPRERMLAGISHREALRHIANRVASLF